MKSILEWMKNSFYTFCINFYSSLIGNMSLLYEYLWWRTSKALKEFYSSSNLSFAGYQYLGLTLLTSFFYFTYVCIQNDSLHCSVLSLLNVFNNWSLFSRRDFTRLAFHPWSRKLNSPPSSVESDADNLKVIHVTFKMQKKLWLLRG